MPIGFRCRKPMQIAFCDLRPKALLLGPFTPLGLYTNLSLQPLCPQLQPDFLEPVSPKAMHGTKPVVVDHNPRGPSTKSELQSKLLIGNPMGDC